MQLPTSHALSIVTGKMMALNEKGEPSTRALMESIAHLIKDFKLVSFKLIEAHDIDAQLRQLATNLINKYPLLTEALKETEGMTERQPSKFWMEFVEKYNKLLGETTEIDPV